MAHLCHRPGCGKPLSPSLVACREEWFQLPASIRNAIWRNYRKGQEHDKTPSREYVVALHAALRWWMTADILAEVRKHGISNEDVGDVHFRLNNTEFPVLKEIWVVRTTLFDPPKAL